MAPENHKPWTGELGIDPMEYDPECDPYFWYYRWGGDFWYYDDYFDWPLVWEEDQGWVGAGAYWAAFEESEAKSDLVAWRSKFGFATPD